ncbi:MAG TPA: alpha/beta hydrolase [Candidatus Obscuribacterales bacterium]
MKSRYLPTRWQVAAVVVAASSTLFTSSGATPLPSSWFDACILRPERYPCGNYAVKAVDGVSYEDVFFPALNGNVLHGWYFQKQGAHKTVLLSHGIGGNVSSRIDLIHMYLQAGTSVFIYDYQGYGRSAGHASLKNVVNDGKAAYNYLTQERGVQPSNLVLAGESLGTGVTCSLIKQVKAAAMILQSPFSSLAKRCAEVVPFLNRRDWLSPANGLSNDEALRSPHPPLLIVHGENDTTVPVSHAWTLYEEAVGPKELLVIDGAGHTGDPALMASPAYLAAVKQFLKDIDTTASSDRQQKQAAIGATTLQ